MIVHPLCLFDAVTLHAVEIAVEYAAAAIALLVALAAAGVAVMIEVLR